MAVPLRPPQLLVFAACFAFAVIGSANASDSGQSEHIIHSSSWPSGLSRYTPVASDGDTLYAVDGRGCSFTTPGVGAVGAEGTDVVCTSWFTKYDPHADAWLRIPIAEDPRLIHRGGSAVIHDGRLYLLGGQEFEASGDWNWNVTVLDLQTLRVSAHVSIPGEPCPLVPVVATTSGLFVALLDGVYRLHPDSLTLELIPTDLPIRCGFLGVYSWSQWTADEGDILVTNQRLLRYSPTTDVLLDLGNLTYGLRNSHEGTFWTGSEVFKIEGGRIFSSKPGAGGEVRPSVLPYDFWRPDHKVFWMDGGFAIITALDYGLVTRYEPYSASSASMGTGSIPADRETIGIGLVWNGSDHRDAVVDWGAERRTIATVFVGGGFPAGADQFYLVAETPQVSAGATIRQAESHEVCVLAVLGECQVTSPIDPRESAWIGTQVSVHSGIGPGGAWHPRSPTLALP